MTLRFKIDENMPVDAAELLRRYGFDTCTTLDQGLCGKPDTEIAAACQAEKRAILTLDLGFGDVRAYPPHEYSGIIVLRLRQQDKTNVIDVVARLATMLQERSPEQRLWIVDEQGIRERQSDATT